MNINEQEAWNFDVDALAVVGFVISMIMIAITSGTIWMMLSAFGFL